MSSNRVVTYIDMKLNSVDEYWGGIVVPSVRAFQSAPSPGSVFSGALSVWHLHDWVWHERYPGQDSHGSAFNAYRSKLLETCPELGWLRDVADAGKHRGLGRMPEVQGAEPQMFSLLPLGIPAGGILNFFLVLNDGSKQNVATVLRSAIEFWRVDLKTKNLPSPFA
jgi:hypothetical protein